MSNGDWIDRARDTRPEDLSSGDLRRLRDEARRSPEVRRSLADDIQLDQALHASLGRPPLSTAKIVAAATAAAAATAGGGIAGTVVSWLCVLVVTAAVGLVTVLALPEPGEGPRPEMLSPSLGSEVPGARAEHIDPVEVDDSSPSDRPPAVATHADGTTLPELAKSSAAERFPGPDKLPAVKAPHEPDHSPGATGVTQK
jgi:hypothetical protein